MGNSAAKQQKDRKRSHDDNVGAAIKRSDRPACKDGPQIGRNMRGPGKSGEVFRRATNPFIIFFLQLRSKKPKENVTKIARIAGRLWARMPADERKKYIDLANAEKKRRGARARKRKYSK